MIPKEELEKNKEEVVKERLARLNKAASYLTSMEKVSHTSMQKDISKIMGYNNSTNVNYAFKGNIRYLTEGFIKRFNAAFENIFNEEWFLEGKGEMLTSYHQEQENITEITLDDIREDIFSGTPVYDIDGTCGTNQRDMQFADDTIIGSVNLPGISKSAKIITANGDSMEPVIHDGSRVVLREIFGWNDIFYGQIYLILMEEYRMIKYIRRYEKDEENYVILRSENPRYDDMRIHKDKIRKLFIVENILSVKNQI